jgi:hypothetical protein
MRRVLVLLVTGTVLSGLAAAYASSGRFRAQAEVPMQQASASAKG